MADNFSSLFEFLPIGAYCSAPDGTMLRANPALARLNGYERETDLLEATHASGASWYVEPGRRELFRAWPRSGAVDARATVADRLPLLVIADLLGLHERDHAAFASGPPGSRCVSS